MNTVERPRLIAVGDNCLDVYIDKNTMAVGGNALNVAVQWHRAGRNARYFGAVGDDAEAEILLDEVARAGLPVKDVERRAGKTAVTLLRETNGDRHFLLEDLGVGHGYLPSDERFTALAGADWVHLGTHSNPELLRRLATNQIPFSVDVSTRHLDLELRGVRLVFASGPEDTARPVAPLLEALLAAGAQRAVVTCGERGAFYGDGTAFHAVPAHRVPVLDTCGAGDSFIARFIDAFCIDGHAPLDAMTAATRAAADTCQHKGGFPQELRAAPDWIRAKYTDTINAAKESF